MSGTPDIVARLSSMAADHGPDGWPAVQMRDITELCDEVARLRAELAEAQQLARDDFDLRAQQRDERDSLRAALAQAGPGLEPAAKIVTVRHFHEYDGSALEDTTGYLVTSVRLLGPEPTKEGTQPLYFGAAHPSPAQREPLSEARVREMLNEANIELRSKWACYERGLRDGERAHGITPSGTKGAART